MSVAAFISSQRVEHGVPHATACRALGVSPSWFYKWHERPASRRQRRRAELDAAVRAAFEASGGTYGSPRITAELKATGWRIGENTVAASMAAQQLVARPNRRRRSLTRADKNARRAPDLVGRDFSAAEPNLKERGSDRDSHRRRQALPSRGGGHVLPPVARLRHERPARRRARGGLTADGRRRPRRQRRRGHLPQRPGQRGRTQSVVATPRDHGGVRWHDVSSRRIGLCDRRCARRAGRCRPGMWSARSGA